MHTEIVKAKKSLYEILRNFDEVSGAAIQEENGSEYIVIFLTKTSKAILDKIPSEFEGNQVKATVKGVTHAY